MTTVRARESGVRPLAIHLGRRGVWTLRLRSLPSSSSARRPALRSRDEPLHLLQLQMRVEGFAGRRSRQVHLGALVSFMPPPAELAGFAPDAPRLGQAIM